MAQDAIPATVEAVTHLVESQSLAIQTLPVPTATGPDEHLIRVKAVAITKGELTWPEPKLPSPPIPGYEVAGIVVKAPADSPFQPGSEVYARTGFKRQGHARQYSIALTDELGHKPRNLSWEEAATVPLSALTAWQALFDHAGFAQPGQDTSENARKRVLITAAAGGVGIWAVQFARLAGIGHIVGTCGPANVNFVQSLGAHEVVDYTKEQDISTFFRQQGNGLFDLVLDGVGGDSATQAWLSVKEGGTLISIVVRPPEKKKPETGVADNVRALFFVVEANREQLDKISALIEVGTTKTVVDSVYSLDEYQKAFDKVDKHHLTGKVVFKV